MMSLADTLVWQMEKSCLAVIARLETFCMRLWSMRVEVTNAMSKKETYPPNRLVRDQPAMCFLSPTPPLREGALEPSKKNRARKH